MSMTERNVKLPSTAIQSRLKIILVTSPLHKTALFEKELITLFNVHLFSEDQCETEIAPDD